MEDIDISVDGDDLVFVSVTAGAAISVEVGALSATQVDVLTPEPIKVDVIDGDKITVDVTTLGAPGLEGPVGPQGPSMRITIEAGMDIPSLHVVWLGNNGLIYKSSSRSARAGLRVVGVLANSVLTGEMAEIVPIGDLMATTLPLGDLFLAEDGSLTSNSDQGVIMLHIGFAVPGRLIINITPPIRRAL